MGGQCPLFSKNFLSERISPSHSLLKNNATVSLGRKTRGRRGFKKSCLARSSHFFLPLDKSSPWSPFWCPLNFQGVLGFHVSFPNSDHFLHCLFLRIIQSFFKEFVSSQHAPSTDAFPKPSSFIAIYSASLE